MKPYLFLSSKNLNLEFWKINARSLVDKARPDNAVSNCQIDQAYDTARSLGILVEKF